MKNLFTLIFCFLILDSCKQKNETEKEKNLTSKIELIEEPIIEITESDYYNFLNDVLEDKTIIETKILKYPDLKNNSDYWREILTPLIEKNTDEKMSEILTKSDINYIFSQHSTQKKLIICFFRHKFLLWFAMRLRRN